MNSFMKVFLSISLQGVDLSTYDNIQEASYAFNPYVIAKESYTKLVNRFISFYPDKNKNEIKKIVRDLSLIARYLRKFSSFKDLESHFLEETTTEERTISFLDKFRSESGVFGMYFMKTSRLCMESRILDIPGLDEEIKNFIIENYKTEDDNKMIYSILLKLKNDTGLDSLSLCTGIKEIEHDKSK